MARRTDITVDFSTSPRLVTVVAPSTALTIQDLDDTLRYIEHQPWAGMQYPVLCTTGGKEDLGGGLFAGITLTLQNALLAFAARGGPSYVQCTVTGGNLVARDVNGTTVQAISPTAFTQVVVAQSTNSSLINNTRPLTLAEFLAFGG